MVNNFFTIILHHRNIKKYKLNKHFMKKTNLFSFLGIALCASLTLTSCQSDSAEQETETSLINSKIEALGFSTDGMYETTLAGKHGFAIEGDIFLTKEMINELTAEEPLTQEKHYVTRNLVNRGSVIDVYMDSDFNSTMQAAFNDAINRYNQLNLDIRFRRTNNERSSDIAILSQNIPNTPDGRVILGRSAGFPRFGRPASPIVLNSRIYDSRVPADAATVIAHEIGHAIGFRHTDFFNRSFSCGTGGFEEDFNNVGAFYVPGTPPGAERGSWMLACSGGSDRPFTSGDRDALRSVY